MLLNLKNKDILELVNDCNCIFNDKIYNVLTRKHSPIILSILKFIITLIFFPIALLFFLFNNENFIKIFKQIVVLLYTILYIVFIYSAFTFNSHRTKLNHLITNIDYSANIKSF